MKEPQRLTATMSLVFQSATLNAAAADFWGEGVHAPPDPADLTNREGRYR
jgi:hypothetical protein